MGYALEGFLIDGKIPSPCKGGGEILGGLSCPGYRAAGI
jgi:hypothetical protein